MRMLTTTMMIIPHLYSTPYFSAKILLSPILFLSNLITQIYIYKQTIVLIFKTSPLTQIFIYLFQLYFSVSFSELPAPTGASANSSSSTNELDSILEELLGLGQEVCAHSARVDVLG